MKDKEEMFVFKAKDGELYNPNNLYNIKRINKLIFSATEEFAVRKYHRLNEYYSKYKDKKAEEIRAEIVANLKTHYEREYASSTYHGSFSKEDYVRDRLKRTPLSNLKLNRAQKWILKNWPISIVKMTVQATKIEDCPEALI
jgi:hypothetical protein